MDREAWRAAVHGVTKSQTWLSDWTTKLQSGDRNLSLLWKIWTGSDKANHFLSLRARQLLLIVFLWYTSILEKQNIWRKKHIYFRGMEKQASTMLCKMYRIQNIKKKTHTHSKTIDYNGYYTIFHHYQLCTWPYWTGRCGVVSLPEIWHILSPWPPEGKFIDTHIFCKVTALPSCAWRMTFPLFLSSCQYFTFARATITPFSSSETCLKWDTFSILFKWHSRMKVKLLGGNGIFPFNSIVIGFWKWPQRYFTTYITVNNHT